MWLIYMTYGSFAVMIFTPPPHSFTFWCKVYTSFFSWHMILTLLFSTWFFPRMINVFSCDPPPFNLCNINTWFFQTHLLSCVIFMHNLFISSFFFFYDSFNFTWIFPPDSQIFLHVWHSALPFCLYVIFTCDLFIVMCFSTWFFYLHMFSHDGFILTQRTNLNTLLNISH